MADSIIIGLTQDSEIIQKRVIDVDVAYGEEREQSPYGVIHGKVHKNGYGIANAHVEVFIALDKEERMGVALHHPYTSIWDKDAAGREWSTTDGYARDLSGGAGGDDPFLLGYRPLGPCGPVMSPAQRRLMPDAAEAHCRYRRLRATTDQSGHYVIRGVPTGPQTVLMEVDMTSVGGVFDLSPRVLGELHRFPEDLYDGDVFRPAASWPPKHVERQVKEVDVLPLWASGAGGGSNRVDFPLENPFTPCAYVVGGICGPGAYDTIGGRGVVHVGDGRMGLTILQCNSRYMYHDASGRLTEDAEGLMGVPTEFTGEVQLSKTQSSFDLDSYGENMYGYEPSGTSSDTQKLSKPVRLSVRGGEVHIWRSRFEHVYPYISLEGPVSYSDDATGGSTLARLSLPHSGGRGIKLHELLKPDGKSYGSEAGDPFYGYVSDLTESGYTPTEALSHKALKHIVNLCHGAMGMNRNVTGRDALILTEVPGTWDGGKGYELSGSQSGPLWLTEAQDRGNRFSPMLLLLRGQGDILKPLSLLMDRRGWETDRGRVIKTA